MIKTFTIAILVIVVVAAVFMMTRNNKAPEVTASPMVSPTATVVPSVSPASSVSPTATSGTTSSPKPTATPQVKVFNILGSNFQFSTTEIKVKKGDRVRINFDVSAGFHDWVVDEFNARTKQLSGGESDSIEFVANKTGTFEFYCSVGSHRQMGMKGNLIVE